MFAPYAEKDRRLSRVDHFLEVDLGRVAPDRDANSRLIRGEMELRGWSFLSPVGGFMPIGVLSRRETAGLA